MSSLSDSNIAWIFSQFSLVHGVYLIHLCPIEHPVCSLLIHTILCQVFNLQSAACFNDNQQSGEYKSKNLFSPGFLLLRCLPSSLCIHGGHLSYLPLSSSSSTSLSNNKQEYQQSLFQLIIQKIRSLHQLIYNNIHIKLHLLMTSIVSLTFCAKSMD
ncbi:unnamed protein product [Heterobilharzia americana]|nr:unnamed protein product [Heterobilharzia americana]